MIRGALGRAFHETNPIGYQHLFRPHSPASAADGLHNWPRPFVLRTKLDGKVIEPGETFHVTLHAFTPAFEDFREAFQAAGNGGFGPARARALLEHSTEQAITLPADVEWNLESNGAVVDFVTPTELKARSAVVTAPTFGILVARAAGRINNLRSLYGDGPLDTNMRELRRVASLVGFGECSMEPVKAERRSGSTHQIHPLGGFLGTVEYVGNSAPFLPLLRIAEYTGVGRQTTWGKGEIRVRECGA